MFGELGKALFVASRTHVHIIYIVNLVYLLEEKEYVGFIFHPHSLAKEHATVEDANVQHILHKIDKSTLLGGVTLDKG